MSGWHGGPKLPAHELTTRHLGAAYPLIAEPGLGFEGVLIGNDMLGGSFVYDPFSLYERGLVSNPNMVVFGQIGRGKSSLLKTYLFRQAVFGRRAWVVDPKGEYGSLARAWGTTPLALRPGGPVRLNPLDPAPILHQNSNESQNEGGDVRQIELLSSLAASCLGRQLLPRERVAVELALSTVCRTSTIPTIPLVIGAMMEPTSTSALQVRTSKERLLEDGRDAALELRRLVVGDLRGMFDGPTSPGLDLGGPLVVLDLSALYNSQALGILMACTTAWLQSALAKNASDQRSLHGSFKHVLVVIDEAWAVLANLGVARWLQASWKLSRAYGIANIAVLHRLSDLQAVGASDSEQVHLAKGLLADSETRVIYAQPEGEVSQSRELLSLSSTEAEALPQLRRGVALWKVGRRSFLVQHRVGKLERPIVDTDQAMTSVTGLA